MNFLKRLCVFIALASVFPATMPAQSGMVSGQEASPGQKDRLSKAWTIQAGGGFLSIPNFTGSKDNVVLALPGVRVRYKDLFFASVEGGIGYNVVHTTALQIGPIARVIFPRYESGKVPLKVGGTETNALKGLGDVDATAEVGGFIKYTWLGLGEKIEVRKAVSGHGGLVGNVDLGYTKDFHRLFYRNGPPLILTFGPRATFVDANYTRAYYGVNPLQSSRSGLPQYKPESSFLSSHGLLSWGAGGAVTIPVSSKIAVTFLGGYDRVSGDIARSPLITMRGNRDQGMGGIMLTYSFGFGRTSLTRR